MDNKYWMGLIVVALVLGAGGATYVLNAHEEVVCRTGNGWEIVQDYGEYVYAECPYTSQEHLFEYCLPTFRATSSKERYGCNKVLLEIVKPQPSRASSGAVTCYTESTGRGCEPVV